MPIKLSSFRSRLITLVLLVLIPACALVFSGDVKRQRSARERARARALTSARLAAASELYYVKQTRQLLGTLAQFQFLVQATNPAVCEWHFSNLKLLSPDYSDFGLVEANGTVFCHTLGKVTNEVISPAFAQKALSVPGHIVTAFHRNPDGTNSSLQFAYWTPSTNGVASKILYASLKLPLLSAALKDIPLPSGAAANVIDHAGRLLARYPKDGNLVGKEFTRTDFVQSALAANGTGTFEASGLDGAPRLYAVAQVNEGRTPVFIVTVGIPRQLTFAEADKTMFSDICGMIFVALAVLAGAWFFSNRAFLRPVEAMVSATERIAAGDLAARTGLPGRGGNELYVLANRIDQMAANLEKRQREVQEAHQLVQQANTELEARVQARTSELRERSQELQNMNQELESFSYSVSHDLRAPLRHMDGFAQLLLTEPSLKSDARTQRYLGLITKAAKQMGTLIDDLLLFSRMGRQSIAISSIDTNYLVRQAVAELSQEQEGREVKWDIGPLPEIRGDEAMLRQVWLNLVSNALKYTRGRTPAEITIRGEETSEEFIFSIKDNGAGFDMKYADKLFGVFQRLHRESEFEGTGIGLANVRRVVHRHGGRTWAEAEVGKGAKFFFSLAKVAAK